MSLCSPDWQPSMQPHRKSSPKPGRQPSRRLPQPVQQPPAGAGAAGAGSQLAPPAPHLAGRRRSRLQQLHLAPARPCGTQRWECRGVCCWILGFTEHNESVFRPALATDVCLIAILGRLSGLG